MTSTLQTFKQLIFLLLLLLPLFCHSQKLVIHKTISAEIADIFYANETEIVERLSHYDCDTIFIYSERNNIIIMPKCKFSTYELKDTTKTGRFISQYVRSFSIIKPTSILTNIKLWKYRFTIQSQNQYLNSNILYKVVLKRGKDNIVFYADDDYGMYSVITFKYMNKKYETECVNTGAGQFKIKDVVNVDGSMNSNFLLCDMLEIKM